MRKLASHLTIAALGLAALAAAPGIAAAADADEPGANVKLSATAFRDTMRKLWEDHITWTRLYIVSAAANLPDKGQTAERLLRNQADIGDGVKAFYGEAAGAKLTALLKDHILGAADLIATAQSGDKSKIQAASGKWYANSDEIAALLSGANPQHWPLEMMKSQMRMHLDMTLAEASARLQGNFAADIHEYDMIHSHILNMADVLTSGIVAQFPDRFDQKR